MKTSSLLGLAMVSLLMASAVHAAGGAGPGDGPRDGHRKGHWGHGGPDMEQRVERMAEELGLSEEQSTQLLAVFEASAAEREALRQKIDEQFKPERCAIQTATVAQVREILTDEQEAELEGRLERWADLGEDKGRRGPRGGFAKDCEAGD